MKGKLKELRQKKADIKAAARAIQDKAAKEDRELTAEEETEIDAKVLELEACEAEIVKAEKSADRERMFAADPSQPRTIDSDEAEAIVARGGRTDRRDLNNMLDISAVMARHPGVPREFLTAGFDSVADFAMAVRGANKAMASPMDERLVGLANGRGIYGAPTNFHQEEGTVEGYMVPPAFREQIWDLILGEPDVVGQVDMQPTNSNSVQVLKDETTPWGTSGIQANWAAEGTQFTPSKLATKLAQVPLHKLYAFVLATEELLEDAPLLNQQLMGGAARAISWKAGDAIVNGTGAGQPLGWMTGASMVEVAAESGQAAGTLVAANVANMFARLLPGGMSRARWYINPGVFPQLLTMTLGDKPIWIPPSASFQDAPGGFLFGRPVVPTQHAQALGTAGDIQLVDGMGYAAFTRASGVRFASSMHLYFDYDMQAFRWTFRLGGEPYLSAAVSPANGSNTLSHFVRLAAR